jgi:RNA polymerase sigma-B factor
LTAPPRGQPRSVERFRLYRAATDDEARRRLREELIEEHLGLAAHLSRRFNHRGISEEDLLQVASIGLLHAIDRFDPERGVEFSTFAAPTILGELKRHFRDRGWAIRIPRRLQELNLRLTTVADELTHQLGRSPTIAEMASAVHASDEEVLEALDAARAYRARPIERSSEDGPLSAEPGAPADDVAILRSEDRMVVEELLDRLEPRERLMLRMRFYDDMTQQEIAERLGISQMQVSRLLSRVLARLRDQVEG